jgi:hypothetical protein
MTLSADQVIYHQMTVPSLITEFKRIQIKLLWINLKYFSGIFLEGLKKTMKNLSRYPLQA